MDFAALNVFLTVVEEGGFSKASQKLLRTQPAVSLAVQRLENALGEKLIDRSSRRLLLTDAGHLVLEYAKRARSLERRMATGLEELRDVAAGRLVIGANESSTLYLLQPLRRYRRRYPNVRIRVQRCRSSQIPDQLVNGELELGMVSYNPVRKSLVSRVMYSDHLAFIVSPKHKFADRDEVSIRELGSEIFIAHNVVSPYRQLVLRRFQKHSVPLNMHVEMPTIESIRKCVQDNEGVAFLPRMCVDRELGQGALKEVLVPELSDVERQIRLLYPSQRKLSRASEAFLELLSKNDD